MVKFSGSDVCGVQGSGGLHFEEEKGLSLYSSVLLSTLMYVRDTNVLVKRAVQFPFGILIHYDQKGTMNKGDLV
jgi:hypothetical protein